MMGDRLLTGFIGVVIASVIGFFALDLFSQVFASSYALEQGDSFYTTQHDFLLLVANNLHWLVGGTVGAVVVALTALTRGR